MTICILLEFVILYRWSVEIKDSNEASWKVAEKIGFELVDKRNYKDINDEFEEVYRFYRKTR